MELNIILAGVGGQGILSVAFVLAEAAMDQGFRFKQSEVHGMAQRGGAVQAHLRISKRPIHSDLVPRGKLDLLLATEPLEALRHCHRLRPGGALVASASPCRNIPNYPDLDQMLARIAIFPQHVLADTEQAARFAGAARAQNMVLLGAAAHLLPFAPQRCLERIERRFAAKGAQAVRINQRAFRCGRQLASAYLEGIHAGAASKQLLCAAPALLRGAFEAQPRIAAGSARRL